MVTVPVMEGRGLAGEIDCGPVPIPKLMTSEPAVAFACWIAARSVQPPPEATQALSAVLVSPVSPVVVTTKVAASATATDAPAQTSTTANGNQRVNRFMSGIFASPFRQLSSARGSASSCTIRSTCFLRSSCSPIMISDLPRTAAGCQPPGQIRVFSFYLASSFGGREASDAGSAARRRTRMGVVP